MYMNFENIKKQNTDLATVIEIIEVLYKQVNDSVFPNIVLNEYVDDAKQSEKQPDEFTFSLSKKPTTISDILVVSDDGTLIITPKLIVKLDGNDFVVKNSRIKNGMKFYVSYKY